MSGDPEIDKLAEIFDTHKMDYPGIKPSDGELFDKVCEIARSRLVPKLSRVHPNRMLDGLWYVFLTRGVTYIDKPIMSDGCFLGTWSDELMPCEVDEIFGPLQFVLEE